jgi:hypothetical protein
MPETPQTPETDSEYRARIREHKWAFDHPYPGFENALAHLIRGLVGYAEVYQARYKVPIASDVALRVDWLKIAQGIAGLLDGDTGRFDCPSLDGLIRSTAESAGFTLALQERK